MIRPDLEYYGVLHGPSAAAAPTIGPHVLAWKRMLERWDPEMYPGSLATLDDVFNLRTVRGTKIAQRHWNLADTGTVNKVTFQRSLSALREQGNYKPLESAWDELALALWRKGKPRVPPARCFPYPEGVAVKNLGGVRDHMARALGNWQSDNAVDIHALRGSIVVAPKPGYVSRGGGYDPHRGPVGTIFGEHATIECDDGTAIFMTHIDRIVSVGERVVAGEIIGRVGDWPGSTLMDHTHIGARGFNPESMWDWPRVKVATAD